MAIPVIMRDQSCKLHWLDLACSSSFQSCLVYSSNLSHMVESKGVVCCKAHLGGVK